MEIRWVVKPSALYLNGNYGNEFETDVLIWTLPNYDMVLGVQWLSTLDTIV